MRKALIVLFCGAVLLATAPQQSSYPALSAGIGDDELASQLGVSKAALYEGICIGNITLPAPSERARTIRAAQKVVACYRTPSRRAQYENDIVMAEAELTGGTAEDYAAARKRHPNKNDGIASSTPPKSAVPVTPKSGRTGERYSTLNTGPEQYFRRWNCVGKSWSKGPLEFNYNRLKSEDVDQFKITVLGPHEIQISESEIFLNGIYRTSGDDGSLTLLNYPKEYTSQLGIKVDRVTDPHFDAFYGTLKIFWEAPWMVGKLSIMATGECKGY